MQGLLLQFFELKTADPVNDAAHGLDGFAAVFTDKGPVDIVILGIVSQSFGTVKIDKSDSDGQFLSGSAKIATWQHRNPGVGQQPLAEFLAV